CSSSASRGAYCALTSTSGIGTPSKSREAPAQDEDRSAQDDPGEHDVLGVAEAAVEAPVAGADPPADAGEREAPDRGAGHRQRRVGEERGLEHAGGDGDEGADDRRQAPEEDRPAVPALEPVLGAVEPLGREMEPAAVTLEERPAAVVADHPPDDPARRVPERAGEGHDQEGPEAARHARA